MDLVLLQVLEEVPDLLAPKPGQQQQHLQNAAALYPHPTLAALFAARPSQAAGTHSSSGEPGGISSSNSSSVLSPNKGSSSEERTARLAGSGSGTASGSTAGTHKQQYATLPVQIQQQQQQSQRSVRASDPTDTLTSRSELFGSSLLSPRAAGSVDSTRPLSAAAARGAASITPTAAGAGGGGGGGVGGAPRVRTAEEIRQAYGRASVNKAQVCVCVCVCFGRSWGADVM